MQRRFGGSVSFDSRVPFVPVSCTLFVDLRRIGIYHETYIINDVRKPRSNLPWLENVITVHHYCATARLPEAETLGWYACRHRPLHFPTAAAVEVQPEAER